VQRGKYGSQEKKNKKTKIKTKTNKKTKQTNGKKPPKNKYPK
jgi:hypothetical protein